MNVIVVGAGVVGLSVAYELTRRGAAVRILEWRGAGQGATRASAGILAPFIEAHGEPALTLGVGALAEYPAFVERLRTDAGSTIEFGTRGTLQVALNPDEAGRLEVAARRLAKLEVPHSLLSGERARALEPSLSADLYAGLELPQHGYVAVPAFVSALEVASISLGAVLERARVVSLDERDGRPVVVTESGTMTADAIVLAAGAWSGGLPVAGVRAPVRPIRGQLIQLQLPSAPASRVLWGEACYVVPWSDGTVLVGATVEDVGFDERATVVGVRQLLERAGDLVPSLDAAALIEVRVGLRPATPDELPVIGASATMRGVFYATGHYRNGVLLAPLTAVLVADLLLAARAGPELAWTRPDRLGL